MSSGTLSFLRAYVEPIKAGRKTQTMRPVGDLARFERLVGHVIDLTCRRVTFERARIVDVSRVSIDDLTLEDAQRDGFLSLETFRHALFCHYPMERTFTRVRFEAIGRDPGADETGDPL